MQIIHQVNFLEVTLLRQSLKLSSHWIALLEYCFTIDGDGGNFRVTGQGRRSNAILRTESARTCRLITSSAHLFGGFSSYDITHRRQIEEFAFGIIRMEFIDAECFSNR